MKYNRDVNSREDFEMKGVMIDARRLTWRGKIKR